MSLDALSPTAQPTATNRAGTNPRTAAVVAGIGYVILFVLSVFAKLVVREGLRSSEVTLTRAFVAGT